MSMLDAIKIDPTKVISDPVVKNQARRFSVRTQLAFLPDDVIGQSWLFRFLAFIYYYIYIYFYDFHAVGLEKLDRQKGYLLISRHSTHNADILGVVISFYYQSGRVLRSLVHRLLIPSFPILRLLGWVPGEPETAVGLLKSGFWVYVFPGGGDEGLVGHENAYKVHWPKKRKGFARVAIEAGVPIVPIFVGNVEEMRWNPILYVWNLLGLGRLFTRLLEIDIRMLNRILVLVASVTWFLSTWFQIPIPVKLTLYIGDPIEYDMTRETLDDVVERSRKALQDLINRYQPQGKSYSHAIKQRLAGLTNYWQKQVLLARTTKFKYT